MAWAPIALGVAGLATSVYGIAASSSAAAKQANYQAQVARNNRQIADNNAKYAAAAGEAETLNAGLKGATKVAGVKAAIAANNIDVNTGSAADVIAGEAATGRQDQLTTANNAAMKVYGYRTQGANFGAQAGLYDSEAASAGPIGALNAAGTLLGGASSIGFKWQGMQDSGGSWAGNDGTGITASGMGE